MSACSTFCNNWTSDKEERDLLARSAAVVDVEFMSTDVDDAVHNVRDKRREFRRDSPPALDTSDADDMSDADDLIDVAAPMWTRIFELGREPAPLLELPSLV